MFGPPEDASLYPIFVYGTLRRGGKNHGLLRHRTLHEQPAFVERMRLFSLGAFPMMIHGDGVVHGQLVTLQPFLYQEILADLDRLEGYRPDDHDKSLYRRELLPAYVDNQHEPMMAWAYVGQAALINPRHPRIESGDWLEYRQLILQKTRFGRFCD